MWRAGGIVAVVMALWAGPAQAAPPELPPPTYATVTQEVAVTMDDGVRLGATVTRPDAPGRFPVVLQMTPYGRDGECGCFPGTDLASRGLTSAVVDVRGTGGSEGTLKDNYFSPREQRDGSELVEWLAKQPWSSGRIGMTGGSYLGITQYLTAEQQPPHLKVITPVMALSDLYREGYTHEGIPNFFFDQQYLAVQQPLGLTGPNSDPAMAEMTINAKAGQATGAPGIAFDYLERPFDGPFYRERSPLYRASKIQVPVLIYDAWHDGFVFGAQEMYRALSKRRGVETRLYVDPCTHKGCGPPFDPMTNPANLENSEAVVVEFLRKHLVPGADAPKRSPVRYYVQGAGEWRDATRWPPPQAREWTMKLDGGSYVTNPAAGLSMAFDQYGTVAASPYVPTDQRLAGQEGLTWRTPVLEKPMTLAGDGVVHLVASTTASDTDWYAKLADVAPDGSETIITAGFLRASLRTLDKERSTPDRPWHVLTKPAPVEAGKLYDFDLAIWPTAYELAKGHRLQLRLTSYDFPTHLPGTLRAGPDDPASTSFVPLPPGTNTVRDGALKFLILD